MPDAEYMLDTPIVRAFIAHVQTTLSAAPPVQAVEAIRPAFAALLADPHWLPHAFQRPAEQSGMGGGIATWLIYRSPAGDLSLFSLVVPAGVATPIHDHLAWGLVGLYAGEQDEEVFAHRHESDHEHESSLRCTARNQLRPGDFYVLLPPTDDIHRVRTTSSTPSVSLHLLGNDTGCVWRHTYTAETGAAQAFRSGWSNVPCRDTQDVAQEA
jgi:predicted metal-dependent enzyme (double-stranded beta helix superfamily)